MTRSKEYPEGAIFWPQDTDKTGKSWLTPISPAVRATLERIVRERPGIGAAYLFPAPANPEKCVTKELASAWLREAETLAKLPKQDGSLWHAYRRGWATARKGHPVQDVALAGGWSPKHPAALQTIYQQPDAATVLRVVMEPTHELREAQG